MLEEKEWWAAFTWDAVLKGTKETAESVGLFAEEALEPARG